MALKFIGRKDPEDTDQFSIDWNLDLGADTILTSTWLTPAGLTYNSDSHANGITTVTISGGTAGEVYELTNRIVTAGGRQRDRSVIVRVMSR